MYISILKYLNTFCDQNSKFYESCNLHRRVKFIVEVDISSQKAVKMQSSQTQNQIVPRRKTFWKMVKTMFMPAQTIAKLMVGCGTKRGKVKRRLTIRNMQQAKDAFLRASLQGAVDRSNSRRVQLEDNNFDNFNRTIVHETRTGRGSNDTVGATNETVAPSSSPRAASEEHHDDSPIYDNISDLVSQLPTPLNLQEAEFLLESLTISSQATNNNNNAENHISDDDSECLELVDVHVEVVCDSVPEDNNGHYVINDENNDLTADSEESEVTSLQERVNGRSSTNQRNRPVSVSITDSFDDNSQSRDSRGVLPRSRTTASFSSSVDEYDFSGWRKSSIEVTSNPPITLAFIPSGLLVGDRIVWVKDDYPEIGTVRWIGKIRQQFYAGIEFDKPVGNSSGIYGYGVGMYKRLFTCQLPYGRFVPVKELVLYKDYHDSGVKSGIVCVICRDDFLDTWEPDIAPRGGETTCADDIQPFNMVSTKCGHLYHWGCLDHWFNTKKRSDYQCPFCSRTMDRNEVIRIFLSQI